MPVTIDRRRWLCGLAAGVAAGLTTNIAHSAVENLSLDELIRVIGRNDGGIAIRWTEGVLTAHIDATSTPLFRVMSQIFSRHRRREDGGYDTVVFELACFADLDSREVLETWRNPFTGATVNVPKTVLGPTPYVITPQREARREARYSGGVPFAHRFVVDADGDDLWISELLDSVMPSPAPGVPGFGFHENFVYHTNAASLRKTSSAHVDTVVQKVNVLGWRPWMLMGTRPGTTVTRAHGRVVADVAQLPDAFRRLNATHGKGLIDDLDTVLAFTPN